MSSARNDDWDWWSEAKLTILTEYLRAFTTAVRGRSSGANYLDLFAGSYENKRRYGSGTFPGSAQIALTTKPNFTRLAFFELSGSAAKLRSHIDQECPSDQQWRVFEGDSNETLPEALDWLEEYRWAPTFAFLDPRGLQVAWSTIERLAEWRRSEKTKVEQLILMPEPALARVLGLKGVQGQRSADLLDRLFGSRDWLPIHQGRRSDELTPRDMRDGFVNLYRWRLEKHLSYNTTHELPIVNTSGQPVYRLVFATDSPPGDAIMRHLYKLAIAKIIPMMQARAKVARQHRKEAEAGVQRLPGIENFEIDSAETLGAYRPVPPWEPARITDHALDLEGTEDIDPADFDWS